MPSNGENGRVSFVGLCTRCAREIRNTAAPKQRRGSRLTLAQRFCFKVRLPADPAGCWEWVGGKSRDGHGFLARRAGEGRTITGAHRVSYELFVGPIAKGLHVDHLCRNPGCVNPDHLEAVTQSENIRRGYAAKRANATTDGNATRRAS